MEDTYPRAYTQVLAILKHLSDVEYNKISKEKIEFLKENCDKDYKFDINPKMPLEEQGISRKANAILVTIYRDYFASDDQILKMEMILKETYLESEKKKQEQYDSKDLFSEKVYPIVSTIKKESLVVYKKNIILRIIDKIKSIFRIKK